MDILSADATDNDLLATARALGHVPGPAALDPYLSHLHYVCCERCHTVLYQSELVVGSRAFQFDGEMETARLTACAAIAARPVVLPEPPVVRQAAA